VTDVEILSLAPDEWEAFRDLRLRALREAPYAFGSRYDDWVDAPDSRWRDRLANVPLNVVARRDGELVGMASGVLDGQDGAELNHLGEGAAWILEAQQPLAYQKVRG